MESIDEQGLGSQEIPPSIDTYFSGAATASIQKTYSGGPSESLYHYTSAAGLIGILGNDTLRFSDASFLNDGSESIYGVELVCGVLDIFVSDKSEEVKNICRRLKRHIEKAMNYFQPFVFCMSEEDNLLNQWRDYGADIVPYSLEFDPANLEKPAGSAAFPTYLSRVVYDRKLQLDLAIETTEAIYAKAQGLIGNTRLSDGDEEALLVSAACEFVWLACRFKNPAFSAEREWRLISHRPDVVKRTKAKYKSGSLGVTPYYDWYIGAEEDKQKLPLKGVTVGPSPYARVSDLALKQFLADHGYTVETHFSTIPIRR